MTTPNPFDEIRAKLSATPDSYVTIGETAAPRRPVKPALTRHVVKANAFDVRDWASVRRNPELHAVIEDLFHGDLLDPDARPGYYNAPELIRDIFMAFFRPYPTLNKMSAVYPDARLNGVFVTQLMALTDYQRLHDTTMTDPLLATMAAMAVAEALKDMIRQNREPVQQYNRQRQQQEAYDQAAAVQAGQGDESGEDGDGEESTDQGQGAGQGEASEVEGDAEAGDGPVSLLDDGHRQFAEDYADADCGNPEVGFDDVSDGLDLARHVDFAMGVAADEIEALDAARKGVGLEDGEWKSMDPTARLNIAERLNTPLMRAIAALMGPMRRFAFNQQAQKVKDVPQEIYSVGLGSDVNHLLLSEFALLGHPGTRVEFFRRYAQGTLLQYQHRGHEDVGEGPVVVLIDNSGSMRGVPENWAKGFAEALRRICEERNRDYYTVFFGKNTQRLSFEFPGGRGPFEKVMEFLSVAAAWGTEFDGILTEGMAKARNAFDGEGKGKADIVFITDGIAHLDQDWIDQFVAERNRIGVRIFGISIAASDTTRSAAMELLEKVCTVVIPVQALVVNDDATATVFSQI